MDVQPEKSGGWSLLHVFGVLALLNCVFLLCSCTSFCTKQGQALGAAEYELDNLARLASQGDGEAGYRLSKMYAARGNEEQSRLYLVSASFNGNTNALYELSDYLIANGRKVEAWHWLKWLERQGDSRATRLLSEIEPIDWEQHGFSPPPEEQPEDSNPNPLKAPTSDGSE